MKINDLCKSLKDKEAERAGLIKELTKSTKLMAILGKEIWKSGPIRSQITRFRNGYSTGLQRKPMNHLQKFNDQFKIKIESGGKTIVHETLAELFKSNRDLYEWIVEYTTCANDFKEFHRKSTRTNFIDGFNKPAYD